jgi:site-specific recombinase XerD
MLHIPQNNSVGRARTRPSRPARETHREADFTAPTLESAFTEALKFRRICPEFRKNYEKAGNRFMNFMVRDFPGVKAFADIRPFMIDAYRQQLAEDKISKNTERLYLRVIGITDQYMIRNHGKNRDSTLILESEMPKTPKPVKRFLSVEQLAKCIARARDNYLPSAVLGFTLGGLAGLRLTEICRLNASRLVLGNCVSIEGRVKTVQSERAIPLCSVALKGLQTHIRYNSKGKQRADGCFYSSPTALSHTMREVLDELFEETGEEEYRLCEPHEGARTTFDNLLYDLGVPMESREGYQGRKIQGEGAANYTDIIPVMGEMASFRDRKINILRERVIDPLEKKLSGMLI